jgi:hypothetical protein
MDLNMHGGARRIGVNIAPVLNVLKPDVILNNTYNFSSTSQDTQSSSLKIAVLMLYSKIFDLHSEDHVTLINIVPWQNEEV